VSIRRIGLVAKTGLDAAAEHLTAAAAWLEKRDITVLADAQTAALAQLRVPTFSREELPKHVDLLLVLGGDGTLLGMADRIGKAGVGVPILGVNFGRLGFLTEVRLDELYPALEAVLAGHALIHERRLLRARTLKGDAIASEHLALNDVVVTRGATSRVIELSVAVDGGFVMVVKGDGLILASPTGSTAYNLAANGPIVHPDVAAMLLTPIAPHTLANRPIVIPGTSTIEVSLGPENRSEVFTTFDGQAGHQLGADERVSVTLAPNPVRIVRAATRSYYDNLREKLGWGER
jgi:NAD+ kinase